MTNSMSNRLWGIGVRGFMAFALAVPILKLFGVIELPWIWALAPIWASIAAFMLLCLAVWWMTRNTDKLRNERFKEYYQPRTSGRAEPE